VAEGPASLSEVQAEEASMYGRLSLRKVPARTGEVRFREATKRGWSR
jgi:hypothetical protein